MKQISVALVILNPYGKIRIAVYSDPHQNYKDMDSTMLHINKTASIDFIVCLGDVTNSGYNFEYDQYLDTYVLFKHPVISVMETMIPSEPEIIFLKKFLAHLIFGLSQQRNASFFSTGKNLEDPSLFDSAWLKNAVETSTKKIFIFNHTSLRDKERDTDLVAKTFSDIIADSKVQMIFNGHNHVYNLSRDGDTVMLQVPRVEGTQWLIVEVQGTQVSITKQATGEVEWETLKN